MFCPPSLFKRNDVIGASAPKYVHLDYIEGMLKLCRALIMPGLAWTAPWASVRQRLKSRARHYRGLLRDMVQPQR